MLDAREKEPTTKQEQGSINNTTMPLPMTKTHKAPTHTQLEAKLKAQQKLQALTTAVEVFKVCISVVLCVNSYILIFKKYLLPSRI
jgi:hypothetical protein